jgi:hypothetical protein
MCKTLQEFISERRTELFALSILLIHVGQPDNVDQPSTPTEHSDTLGTRMIWLASSASNLETKRD